MVLDMCVQEEASDGGDDRCSGRRQKTEAWRDGNPDLGAGRRRIEGIAPAPPPLHFLPSIMSHRNANGGRSSSFVR
jgi:hypothetical protein